MKIGDIDVPMSIIDLEHRMIVLERLLDYIFSHNRSLDLPSKSHFDNFKDDAIKVLQGKYPGMGITKKD